LRGVVGRLHSLSLGGRIPQGGPQASKTNDKETKVGRGS
jgi:hypothetical protein